MAKLWRGYLTPCGEVTKAVARLLSFLWRGYQSCGEITCGEVTLWRGYSKVTGCLARQANFIYGLVLAKVLSHVTSMPVLLRPVNNFLGQVIGNASEGKYNTVNNSSSPEVTFQKCLNSQKFATGAYQRLHEARPRRVVWLWEPE